MKSTLFYKPTEPGDWFTLHQTGTSSAGSGFSKQISKSNGSLYKYKAHLIEKKIHQVLGFDFNETFSLVIKPIVICVLLTLVLAQN